MVVVVVPSDTSEVLAGPPPPGPPTTFRRAVGEMTTGHRDPVSERDWKPPSAQIFTSTKEGVPS